MKMTIWVITPVLARRFFASARVAPLSMHPTRTRVSTLLLGFGVFQNDSKISSLVFISIAIES